MEENTVKDSLESIENTDKDSSKSEKNDHRLTTVSIDKEMFGKIKVMSFWTQTPVIKITSLMIESYIRRYEEANGEIDIHTSDQTPQALLDL